MLFCSVLFFREISITEVKTPHAVNMGTAGKSGVMVQRNVKSHRSFIHQATITTQTCETMHKSRVNS